MKKKNIKRRKNISSNSEISVNQEFGRYCDDYISQGNNLEEVRNYLHFACMAWNLSLYPKNIRDEQAKLIADEYEKSNPDLIKSELLYKDLSTLIDQKLQMYPEFIRKITKIEITENENQFNISTESELLK